MENQEIQNCSYTKEQFLKSNRFMHRKDAVNAVLKDGAEYTPDEAEQLIENYMKGRVK